MRLKSGMIGGIAVLMICSGMLSVFAEAASASSFGVRNSAGIRNQPTDEPTFNWAGYVQSSTSGEFTAIEDKWTVPTVVTSATGDEYSQQIIGIGGYNSDSTTILVGTDADNLNGKAHYDAFYQDENTGGTENVFSDFSVKPGDVMTAEIWESQAEGWNISIADSRTHEAAAANIIIEGFDGGISAEAALDRPCLSGDCYVNAINYANLAKTSDITFPKGEVSISGPGTPSFVPLMSSVSNATAYNLFMKNYDMDKIIACASNPSSNNKGFTAAYGKSEPPPPNK
ncbi:MAG: G1 family glutamic endopeptidase [Acidimicrobiales bacterium]